VIVFFMLVVAALANAESHDEHTGAVHHGEPDPSSDSRSALPESRNASGTAWQPDSTPMHGLHFMKGTWTMMAHWNFFGGYDHQGSDRGDSQWLSTNWGMLMEKRSVGAGELVLRQMLTLEPFTVGAAGYPLLLQTGESFNGAPIHDRQHPHDLFMEIAALYTRPISESVALQLYAAPVGEPALGPVAFPHRYSAFSDPLAPLGHHWQDSTHISFGVLTAGLFTRKLKVEGSWFNGREPDEHRYDFDIRRPERLESGDKTGHDLVLPATLEQDRFSITSLVGGYEFPFFRTQRFSLDLGARASVNLVDDDLEPFYGSSKPTGYMIFLHLYPGEMAQMPPGHRM
jgi:hypothetical protein